MPCSFSVGTVARSPFSRAGAVTPMRRSAPDRTWVSTWDALADTTSTWPPSAATAASEDALNTTVLSLRASMPPARATAAIAE